MTVELKFPSAGKFLFLTRRQPLFQSIDSRVGPKELGWVFAAYCGSATIAGAVFARVSSESWARGNSIQGLFAVTGLIVLIGVMGGTIWQRQKLTLAVQTD